MTLETLKIEFLADSSKLEGKISALSGQLDVFSEHLSSAVDQAALNGGDLVNAFSNGISSGANSVRQTAQRVAVNARFATPAALRNARSAGASLTTGFANGISDKASVVGSAVRRIVNQATRSLRELLDIHSPSRVAAQFGGYFGEGFALGIKESVAHVAQSASLLGASATGGLSASLPQNMRSATHEDMNTAANAVLENLNLTIPLNVDGMKLGEASIRGINAVTRSTGRLLLNI